jgi:hypothetical protein
MPSQVAAILTESGRLVIRSSALSVHASGTISSKYHESHRRLKTMAEQLSRKKLYDLVWSEPMRNLSVRFGISDVALTKEDMRTGRNPYPGPRLLGKERSGEGDVSGSTSDASSRDG